jgi:hypothetical protein
VLRFIVPRPVDGKDAADASQIFAADQEDEA